MKAVIDKPARAGVTQNDPAAWPPLAATRLPAEYVLRRRDRGDDDGELYRAESAERVCAALTWNVFHTLRLIAPSFWMRRLRARLVGLDGVDYVPLSATISLWEGGEAPNGAALADVVIETDHAVMGLVTLYRNDLDSVVARNSGMTGRASGEGRGRNEDPIAALIDDVTQRAGVRDCYVGIVAESAGSSPVAAAAVGRHAGLRTRTAPLPTARYGITKLGVGFTTWADLCSILQDAASAPALDRLERDAARRTVRWLKKGVGVSPAL